MVLPSPIRKDAAMAIRVIDGRSAIDRDGVSAMTRASLATVAYWHLHRATTGFPDLAMVDQSGRQWWWQDEVQTFQTRYRAARASGLTSVDRSGDPDELLTAPQAARVLGYRSHRNLTRQLLDRADQIRVLPSGRLRRRWRRATVWAYADERPDHTSSGRPGLQRES